MDAILSMSKARSFSIHDVGCGLGHLHSFLKARRIPHSYSGSDLVPEFVREARRRCPDASITCEDFLSAKKSRKYDFVVCNGMIHLPAGVDQKEWRKFSFDLISRMFASSRGGIAFNFLTTYKTAHNSELFYLDPREIFDYCQKKMSRFVTLDHAYPLYEATVTVFTTDFIESLFKSKAFRKYF